MLVREVPVRRAARCRADVLVMAGVAAVLAVVVVVVDGQHMRGCRKSEAGLQLNRLARNARLYHANHGAYPTGQSSALPASTCCPKKCVTPPAAWAADPVWSALDFALDGPHRFQYS